MCVAGREGERERKKGTGMKQSKNRRKKPLPFRTPPISRPPIWASSDPQHPKFLNQCKVLGQQAEGTIQQRQLRSCQLRSQWPTANILDPPRKPSSASSPRRCQGPPLVQPNLHLSVKVRDKQFRPYPVCIGDAPQRLAGWRDGCTSASHGSRLPHRAWVKDGLYQEHTYILARVVGLM